MRHILLATLALVSVQALAQQPSEDRVLFTGHHGTILSTGLEDPRYLLSFPATQRLVLRTARERQISAVEAQRALEGLPFRLEHLEAAGILKRDGENYRIAYMVLSADDERAMYEVSLTYGPSLADAFIAEAERYRQVFSRYPHAELRSDLAFVTVAGYTLNWDGLRIGTELGMRAQPVSRGNGDRYLLYSKEPGRKGDVTGFYWGSHSSNPVGNIRLSTFGDSRSQPRIGGLPDIYFGVTDGIEAFKTRPELVAATTSQIDSAMDDVLRLDGAIMLALRDGPKTARELQQLTGGSELHVSRAIDVLVASSICASRTGRNDTRPQCWRSRKPIARCWMTHGNWDAKSSRNGWRVTTRRSGKIWRASTFRKPASTSRRHSARSGTTCSAPPRKHSRSGSSTPTHEDPTVRTSGSCRSCSRRILRRCLEQCYSSGMKVLPDNWRWIVLAILVALAGCDPGVQSESQTLYDSVSYGNAANQERLKQARSSAGIPFEVVTEQRGQEFIRWEARYSAQVERVKDSIFLPSARSIHFDPARQSAYDDPPTR